MPDVIVSVIIPSYHDWERLGLCLEALANQHFPQQNFEVIVVNNDPADKVFINTATNVTVITEARPGSYAARNAALKVARGKIIGFTDADCIPDHNWISNAVAYLNANPGTSRVAGKVAVFCTPQRSKIELYDTLFAFNQKSYVKTSGTSVTANLFTYKRVFESIGDFDEKLMSGGDFFWGTRANKEGFKVEYVENVVVNHPARDSIRELVKKEVRVGGSQAIFMKDKKSVVSNFFRFLKTLVPRLSDLKFIFKNAKSLPLFDKLYIFYVRQYLLAHRAYAKLRVQMNKKPTRA